MNSFHNQPIEIEEVTILLNSSRDQPNEFDTGTKPLNGLRDQPMLPFHLKIYET